MKIYLVHTTLFAIKMLLLLPFLLTSKTTISSSITRDELPYTVEIRLPDSRHDQASYASSSPYENPPAQRSPH
jgi:hypothetical protein